MQFQGWAQDSASTLVLLVLVSGAACGCAESDDPGPHELVFETESAEPALLALSVDRPGRIVELGAAEATPLRAPDGRKVAVHRGAALLSVETSDGSAHVVEEVGVDPASGSSIAVDFAWSPDSLRLAYQHAEVGICRADGSEKTVVAPAAPANDLTLPQWLSWAPDSSRLAYAHAGKLRVVSRDGTDEVTIVDSSVLDEDGFAWAPDASRLAYVVETGTTTSGAQVGEVWVAQPSGTGSARIWSGTSPHQVAFSANGMHVAIGAPGELIVARTDGSASVVHPLAEPGDFASAVLSVAWSWSPSGGHLAFVRQGPAAAWEELAVTTPDGPAIAIARHEAIDGKQAIAGVSWHPSSDRLVYTRPATTPELHIIDRDGQNDQLIASSEFLLRGGWNTDGSSLLFADGTPESADVRLWESGSSRPLIHAGVVTGLAWSDGDGWIVYWDDSSLNGTGSGIRAVRRDGTRARSLWDATSDTRLWRVHYR